MIASHCQSWGRDLGKFPLRWRRAEKAMKATPDLGVIGDVAIV